MASKSVSGLFLITICVIVCCVSCFEFEVGGPEGWVVPPANDSKLYNDWASENRFRVGDNIHFKYLKDSVMAVTEAEYKKCNSTRPAFFSNTGNTVYVFNHSGSFYFISGVSGHCEKGQRMIVKVMSSDESESGRGSSPSSSSAASPVAPAELFPVFPASMLVPFVLALAHVVSVSF
ncbi:mavicyanin [Punica granatum]|uniref:Mavicyanin n=2 Tax=Punica granatum TaxID=22663 RepID=A0A6P8CRN5_PUNGR|nr:mavicyanin [Punica granatum]PKI79114.1 hypothetical protein CRG98_000406 [Punica granatum]